MCGRDVEIKRAASRDYDFDKHLDGAGRVWQINICAVRMVIPNVESQRGASRDYNCDMQHNTMC